MYLQRTHLGICQCLQEESWINEESYEVQGVNIGKSAILSEAPRKGRHNRAQQVKRGCQAVVLFSVYII